MSLSLIVDKSLWLVFLALVLVLPFMPPFISESVWWPLVAIVFLSLSIYLSLCAKTIEQRSQRSLKLFLPIFVLLLMSVVWQLVQILLGGDHVLVESLKDQSTLSWFFPQERISVSTLSSWWQVSASIFTLGFCFLAVLLINTRSRIKQLLWLLTFICVVHAVIGVVAKFNGLVLVDRLAIDGHYDVARGLFVNRNHFASFLILSSVGILALVFQRLLQAKERASIAGFLDEVLSPNLLLYVASMVILFALMLSQSRAAVLAVMLSSMLVLMLFALLKRRIDLKALGAIVVAFLGLSVIFAGDGLVTRLYSEGLSLGERVLQWSITWEAIQDRWFSGYGSGTYAFVFQAYRGDAPLREVVFDQAHNYWLTIWLEQGLPGLVIQLAIVFLAIQKCISNLRASQSSLTSGVLLACLFVILCSIIQSLVDFNLQVVNLRVFYLLAVLLIFISPTLSRRGKNVA